MGQEGLQGSHRQTNKQTIKLSVGQLYMNILLSVPNGIALSFKVTDYSLQSVSMKR